MKRFSNILFLTLMVVAGFHCGTDEVRFINVSPSITSIGPIEKLDDNQFKMYLSLADWESDPVDIAVEWRDPEGNGGSVEIVPLLGHGIVGLASSPDGPGTLHEIYWTADFDGAESIQIQITPDDFISKTGPTATSPLFPVEIGLENTYYP